MNYWVIVAGIGTVLGPFSSQKEAQNYFDQWAWEEGSYIAEIQTPYGVS